jgi:hypothetical protein
MVPSGRSVSRTSVLNTMNRHHLGGFVDAVDDPVVTPAGGIQPGDLPHERLPQPVRVLGDDTVKTHQGRVPDLGGDLVQVTETLGGDTDLVHTRSGLGQRQRLSSLDLRSRSCEGGHEVWVPQDVEGLLERVEIVGTHKDERRSPVSSHQNPLVLTFDPFGQFGEVGLGL